MTKYGPFRFSAFHYLDASRARYLPCGFKSTLENTTGVGWHDLAFSVELGGIGVDGQRSSITIPVEIAVISGDEAKLAFANCSGDWPKIDPDQVSISMMAGTPNASDVASLNQREKIRQQVVSETARRQAYIAKLPLLNSRSGVAFVGSDRKCAEQFQQAVTLDGLERRKRIAELVAYGCGIVVDSPVHVQINRTDENYATVTIAEGSAVGKSGWVPLGWLK